MAPDGWQDKVLGQIFEFKNGLNTEKEQYGDGYKFVNVMDVFGNDVLTESNIIGRVQVTENQLKAYKLKFGDVLFNRTSETFDEIAMSAVYMDNAIATFGGFVIRGRPIDDSLIPNYSVFVFQSSIFRNQVIKLGQGAVRANIGQKDLSKVSLLLPPVLEQKKIALILSTWDKAIATTEKLLENSQKQKQALMQQLLTGKKRFWGFNDKWLTKSLGEIGEIRSAGVDKNIVKDEQPVRLLNFTDVFNRSFIYSEELNHWVTAPDAKGLSCDVKKGDIFFTPSSETRDEVAIPAVAAEDINDCCYSYHVVRFRLHENWDLNFKAYIFTTPEFRKQAYMLADGSGQRYVISQDGFRSIEITYPTYQEQVLIGRALKAAEDEVNLLKQKVTYLKEEKKSLMQQLLTGKRRVKVEH